MRAADLLGRAAEWAAAWRAGFGPVPEHPALEPASERLAAAWEEYTARMAGNPPFFNPAYAAQMLKPPHPVAAAGYLAALLVNPNNHALDGGPVTSEMEREVVAALAAMLGLPTGALGHLTSSGTIANLEALWVARELHPGRAVLVGANAHYTHERMCGVLGVPVVRAGADASGHLDLDDADRRCRAGGVGTVVLTAGTTGLGAVDRIEQALALRERHGVRLHVDAAYGGFFALLAGDGADGDGDGGAPVPAASLRAIGACDSVVVDPHKHGLQPYGCGAVIFRDPAVAALYRHDSPYTYFTSADLHLGEISLECSRAGAAAGALWLTLRALPLEADSGLGPILRAGLAAARDWARRIEEAPELRLHVRPELDIVTYLPEPAERTAAAVDAAAARMMRLGLAEDLHLALLRVAGADFAALHPDLGGGGDVRVLRSVLMKPEHEPYVPVLHERVRALARAALVA